MTKDSWEEFSNTTTGILDKKELKQPITNKADFNRHWHYFNEAVKTAAKKHIPMAKVSSRQAYTFSGKATQLHTSLQKINCILRQLKHNNHTNTTELIELDNINKELKYISKNTDNETLEITNNHLNTNNIT